MPDSYTHASIALQALLCAKQGVASLPCYLAGAGGPDPLAFYQFWRRKRHPDLAALADRIHREHTGKFLSALLENSITPQQQSYTMGFLTHYATDCTLNPYISAMGDAGFYQNKLGRIGFETALDSELFYRSYRSRTVPLYAATPMLLSDDLAQVAALLRESILATYGQDIPTVDLADAYHENVQMRKSMISPRGGRKAWLRLSAPLRVGHLRAAQLVARVQPGAPLPHLPENWKNPYLGEEMHLTFDEVLVLAEQTGAACILAAMRYWLGEIDEDKMARILGDNNYYTGRPASLPEDTPPEEEAPVKGETPIEETPVEIKPPAAQEEPRPRQAPPPDNTQAQNTAGPKAAPPAERAPAAPLSASLPNGGSPYGSMGPQAFTIITETDEEDG